MEENKDKEEITIYDNPQELDYYISTNRKAGDFFLGFLIFIGMTLFYWFLILNFIASLFSSAILAWGSFFVSISTVALLSTLFFKNGRRFIAIGIIATSLIPLLVFGSCILMFG
jgi:hypothetical protein